VLATELPKMGADVLKGFLLIAFER
jgi:hypothetical protein